MNTYTDRPWLALYPAGSPTDITTEFDTALAMFEASCETAPDAPLIRYFDATLTLRDVDNAATALASTLVGAGFGPGDRLALFTQNDPAYVIGMIGAWKAGGTAVAVNPMSRARELTHLLADSGAVAMVVLDDLYEEVAREVIATVPTDIRTVITTSAWDWQTRNDPRLFRGTRRPHPDGTLDLREVIADNAGRTLPSPGLSAADPAVLIYTSGTTGKPKGAVNSHRNLVFNAQVCSIASSPPSVIRWPTWACCCSIGRKKANPRFRRWCRTLPRRTDFNRVRTYSPATPNERESTSRRCRSTRRSRDSSSPSLSRASLNALPSG
jgi:long-chain acyl-CoA synthetase